MPGKFNSVETVQGKPVADKEMVEPEIDFRIQGISYAAVEREEDDRIRLIRRLVYQVKNHPNKDALTADWQSERASYPFSEESKQMIHNLGNVDCFELSEISPQSQCPCCLKYGTGWIECCTCGLSTEFTRKLTGKRFDALTIPDFVIRKRKRHGVCHGKTEEEREYRQAQDCLRRAVKNEDDSILQLFQQSDTHKISQEATGWDEENLQMS